MPQKKSKQTTPRKERAQRGRQAGANSVAAAQRASDQEKRGHLPPLQLRTDAAGIDIGSQEIAVAVPPGSDPDRRKTTDPKWVSIEIHGFVPWEPRPHEAVGCQPFSAAC